MNFKLTLKILLLIIYLGLNNFYILSQDNNSLKINIESDTINSITNDICFNGYTDYWHNNYSKWHRYGNLFKISIPDINPIILQSKIDVADDIGLPGLLMQEGFISKLFTSEYKTLENPTTNDIENLIDEDNLLVLIDSESKVGKHLNLKGDEILQWADKFPSYQLKSINLQKIKAFYIENGNHTLFVITSSSKEPIKRLQNLILETKSLLDKYNMHKGWFGASSLLKSVTITPGHPLDIIGYGMNEGNSWFIFDGYMEFLAKRELENWVKEVNLPIIVDVGTSPIYGCNDYDGLQIQDMTRQSWIDYAKEKNGYIFNQVYDPESAGYKYDGYFASEGNKEQIDNEDVPFVLRTGSLNEGLTSSMILFIEKEKQLTNKSLWNAILTRKEVAILDQAKMMGPAKYRNALQLLYLDKIFLDNYFNDNLDIQTKVDGYDLFVKLKNYSSRQISGRIEVITSPSIKVSEGYLNNIILNENETKIIRIPLKPQKEAMGVTNPIALNFLWDGNKKKTTVNMLDLPPAISLNQLLFSHAPEIRFPVTIHNFTEKTSFPVEIIVSEKNNPNKIAFQKIKQCEIKTASFDDVDFKLRLSPGNYLVQVNALGTNSKSQLGVGKADGSTRLYEIDLNGDGINEYRLENDLVQVTLLKTGARVIEYNIKSKNDNIFFKSWPEKVHNHKSPFRMRRYYPYGGFEDFLGQASMETHQIFDAKIVKREGDFVQVEMETDFYGNKMKKIFTLYGNTPLLEIRFELVFTNPEANVIGPQPILELGKVHGPEDVYTVPTTNGQKEFIMREHEYYGQALNVVEGWNAGYDTSEDVSFIGAFPVSQPNFLHMWMNHPNNIDTPYYYVEFQPWIQIIQKSKMYFSYYIWGSSGHWKNSLNELEKRNLITVKKND